MKIENWATNYCLTRFNAEYYTDKEVYLRHADRVLRELQQIPDSHSYGEFCDYLDPKVSIRFNPSLLGKNPLQEDEEEIKNLEKLLELGISDVTDLEASVRAKTVFIKPNLNFVPGDINSYAMTDPRLLLALANVLYRYGARIQIGEKPGQKRRSADSYELLRGHFGIPYYVEFVEIDSEPFKETETSTKLVSPTLALPESYLLADFVIDIPKMKTHTLTGVSLGMKNLFGLLTDEERMKHHNEDINPKLVDLLSVRSPDLTIIDGLISLEGQGPLYGTPRNSNLLVVGNNCVSADAVSSYLMGFHPKDIQHIASAYRMGLGDINLRNMHFPAKTPYAIRTNFKRGNSTINPFEQIEVVMGEDIPSGYLNALSHSLERLNYEGKKPREVKIYLGKFKNTPVEDGVVVFGDVTANSVNHQSARVINGHPPRAFELYNMLKQ